MSNHIKPKRFRIKGVRQFPYIFSIFFIMIVFSSANVLSQSRTTQTNETKQKEIRPAYIDIAVGLNISGFRDFATSPLIYSGKPLFTSLSHIDTDEKRESHIMFSYYFGNYENNFNQHISGSMVNTVSFNYLELYQIKKLSSEKLNFKLGGQLNSTVNLRDNEDLFNNSDGADIISTLFGSAKATLDLSRTEEKQKKFLFIKYKAQKRKRSLAYTFNVGIVNSSYRNGFAYTSPSAPLNSDDFFAGYELQIFEGFRLISALDYTVHLHHKNAVQFSYIWDAYRTGGHHDNFEMAAHILKFSLLYGLK